MKSKLTLLALLLFVVCAATGHKTVQINWSYYPDYGSNDVDHLSIYKIEKIGNVSISDTTFTTDIFVSEENVAFVMTATDTAGNESIFSSADSIKFKIVKEVQGIKVKEL